MAQFLCEIGGVFLQVVALDFEGACFQGVVGRVVAAEVPGDACTFRQFVRVETGEDGANAVHPLFVAEDVGAAATFAADGKERGVVAGKVGVVARDIGTHAEGEDFFVSGAEGIDLVEVAGEIHRVHHWPVFDGFFEARPVVGALRQGFFEKTGEHPPLPQFEDGAVGEALAAVALPSGEDFVEVGLLWHAGSRFGVVLVMFACFMPKTATQC